MTKKEWFEQRLAAAKHWIAEMDAEDRSDGFPTPADMGREEVLRVAFAALECGVHTADWDAVFEAYVMLGTVITLTVDDEIIAAVVAAFLKSNAN